MQGFVCMGWNEEKDGEVWWDWEKDNEVKKYIYLTLSENNVEKKEKKNAEKETKDDEKSKYEKKIRKFCNKFDWCIKK